MPESAPLIPFNRPHLTGRELAYIQQAAAAGQLAGNGRFTRRCQSWLEERLGAPRALLTHSCTAALEMSALLIDLQPGDEVIMPSFTFVSTANAFVLRGARPVFVDIRPDTLNLDERLVEAAITNRTKAIVVVHYAGVACDMDRLMETAARRGIVIIEDAAHALLSRYKDRPLGSFGQLATFSFHETKNVISGEGGALVINDARFAERAEILWEKGTNRSKFFRGQVDKYTWVDVGSSFLPGELTAAFLWAQLEQAESITAKRLTIWNQYLEASSALVPFGLRMPIVPVDCTHNAHLYYVLLPSQVNQAEVLRDLNARGVNAVFHYVPLHSSPAGQRYGHTAGSLDVTDDYSNRIVRLPLWVGLPHHAPREVIDRVVEVMTSLAARA
ncbi:MAG TPA: dTDP-4-amino-4,6-dideoxygalactose transaminase [Vicinamibacterales bacterium]|jgi:dTDP-4-amino-4,6-dideoxygalactose transaminase